MHAMCPDLSSLPLLQLDCGVGVQRCAAVKRGDLLDLLVYARVRESLEPAS